MNVSAFSRQTRPGLLLTEIEFLGWIGQASPGERLTYHRGFLALDRSRFAGRLSEGEASELSRVADRAWLAAQHGLAHLVQQRNGKDDFNYLIVARERKSGALSALLDTIADRTWPAANEGALADAA